MSVCIRVDSSYEIGSGHLHRCLTLGEALRGMGERVLFVCRDLPGSVWRAAEDAGFEVLPLPGLSAPPEKHATAHATWLPGTRADDARSTVQALESASISPEWVIVDAYALDAEWESAVRTALGCRIAVIDDLADRPHDCEVLLDTGCAERLANAYERLSRRPCELLLGPGQALLRREFGRARLAARVRESLRRVLVFFGGVDSDDTTAAALHALAPLCDSHGLILDVVWGASYSHADDLRKRFEEDPGVHLIGPTHEIAPLMARADLAVGAGGTTTWERCYLGLPAVLAILAANQDELVSCVARAGAARALPRGTHLNPATWRSAVTRFLDDPEELPTVSQAAFELMAQAGTARAHRVAEKIFSGRSGPPPFAFRPVAEGDLPLLLQWRNSAEVARWMTEQHEVTPEEHEAWYRRLHEGSDRRAWIFESAGEECGFFQLRDIDFTFGTAEWGFYLAPEAMGRGLSRALCFLGAEAAFDEVGLDSVKAHVLKGNARSDKLHDEFGFTTEEPGPSDAGHQWRWLTYRCWEETRPEIARLVYRGEPR